MRRMMMGVGISATIVAMSTGVASAAAPAVGQSVIYIEGQSGSSELGRIVIGNLINFPLAILNALQSASSGSPACDNPLCVLPG
ncbi:hypothetical protein [Nocardia salmonicida]|uniref:hypothetical protein n=1 Tax=Nocardia salmonicida TaxID=53431 RepID=UPI0037BBF7C0